ncbi:MAG: single-stranded DNA-binding protein [Candidatus Gracilibacteria bacterium]|nr:single-stranded DNA-binding protein [Candidatus Gracilibacteria bacterium]
MRTVNKVILIGNITRDPLIKDIDNNKKVALFSLATNRYYKTAEGENKSESEFHNCVAWGNLADRVEKFLTKGKLVYVEGRLRTRIIDKEDGTKSYKTEVVISNLIFLNKKSDFDSIEPIDDIIDDVIEIDDKF